jgi:serine/threonine-protein kinase
VCRALAAAHAQGVVHRDLKPENVFLQRMPDGEEHVKIVDFGIAQLRSNRPEEDGDPERRLTKAGTIFGTPEYMAPEQALGQDVDLRSDVYALGVILFEMFAGEVPFDGETFVEVLSKHLTLPPPRLLAVNPHAAVSLELCAVIDRALEKEREQRFQSMAQLAAALRATPEGARVAAIAHGAPIPDILQSQLKTVPPPSDEHDPIPLSRPVGDAPPSSASAMQLSRTQTELEAVKPARPSKGKSWPLSLLLLAIVAAGGAATLVLRRTPAPPNFAEAAEKPAPAKSHVDPPKPEAPAPAVTEPAPAGSVIESLVRLDVQTKPANAILLKNGFQVCDSTPCDVLVKPDETLELEARKGTLRGFAKVLAQQDQHVTIALGQAPAARTRPAARPPKAGAPAAGSTAGGRMCEVDVDGLKILRPCP